jgi:glycerate 2-kinase
VKQSAESIFRAILAAIDIPATFENKLVRAGSSVRIDDAVIDLREYREIVAIAFGKAAFAMTEGLVRVLAPEYRPEGIMVVPAAPKQELAGWTPFFGGHPLPNVASFEAGRAILDRLARCDERTLIFFLISGGGSSLVEQPLDLSVSLDDFRKLNSVLVTCGAPIEEINAVRKHFSAVKGGRLAAAAPRSMKVTLAVSDVPQGHESALASGPTLPDPTTIHDVERIAAKYDLRQNLPRRVRAILENHQLRETPKPDDPALARSQFVLLLGMHELFHASHHCCEAQGYLCICDNATDDWPIDRAANYLLAQLEAQQWANPGRPVAVIADGELSCPVTGDGVGGRNAAFVLACVPKIAGSDITVLSAGTDGIDGNSPAAGAVAEGETLARAEAAALSVEDCMRRSDAYNFFARLGDTIVTGPTGNNLRDLRILLSHGKPIG